MIVWGGTQRRLPKYWRQILPVSLLNAGGSECSFAKAINVTLFAVNGSTNVVIQGGDGDTTGNGVR